MKKEIEELKDIEGAVHMVHDHGDRFRGWYFFKEFVEKKSIPLKYRDTDLSYMFNIYDYKYMFIMPAKIEFCEGMIAYTPAERHVGIFRFPRDEEGRFRAPFPAMEIEDRIRNLTEEEIKDLLKSKSPLVFEAFKIPRYNFKLFDLNEFTMKEISEITDEDFVLSIKKEHERVIKENVEEIKKKVLAQPDYLLILENTLNRIWKDPSDLVTATGGIIHI